KGKPNTFNVSSLAPAIGGVLDGIAGALVLVGTGADTLNVDDSGSKVARTGSLTDTTLTGLGMGTVGITFSGMATFKLGLGSGVNTFRINVTSNLPPTATI